MGRRALRKISSSLDLSAHHFELGDLPTPLDVQSLFQQPQPLEVEVGSGKGLFLAQASAAQLDHNFLGLEIAARYARFAAAKLARQGQTNAVMIHGDAQKFFHERLAEGSVRAVHVYFPDPWWKKRHWRRRIMNPDFAGQIQRVLEPGGLLHFWTDVQEYFELTCAVLQSETSLEGPLRVPEKPAEHDMDFRTHFERRTRLHEQPVFRAQFRK